MLTTCVYISLSLSLPPSLSLSLSLSLSRYSRAVCIMQFFIGSNVGNSARDGVYFPRWTSISGAGTSWSRLYKISHVVVTFYLTDIISRFVGWKETQRMKRGEEETARFISRGTLIGSIDASRSQRRKGREKKKKKRRRRHGDTIISASEFEIHPYVVS